MMQLEGYEDRFVAFLDILGFKELIHSIESNQKECKYDFDRINSILHFLYEESVESNTQHDLLVYEEVGDKVIEKELGNPRITYVSDCIIISTEGTLEGFKSLCNKVTKFSTDIACDGIFLRGAITHGKLHHHGPFLFGSAYQKAYQLESEKANYPRVIVDDIIYDVLRKNRKQFPLSEPTIVRDRDGIRYLANFPVHYHPQYVLNWLDFLLKVKGRILYHLNRFDERVSGLSPGLERLAGLYYWRMAYGWDLDFSGANARILEKYEWLRDEFNRTVVNNRRFLSADSRSSKLGGVKSGLRILPIIWEGSYWGPEKELANPR